MSKAFNGLTLQRFSAAILERKLALLVMDNLSIFRENIAITVQSKSELLSPNRNWLEYRSMCIEQTYDDRLISKLAANTIVMFIQIAIRHFSVF